MKFMANCPENIFYKTSVSRPINSKQFGDLCSEFCFLLPSYSTMILLRRYIEAKFKIVITYPPQEHKKCSEQALLMGSLGLC